MTSIEKSENAWDEVRYHNNTRLDTSYHNMFDCKKPSHIFVFHLCNQTGPYTLKRLVKVEIGGIIISSKNFSLLGNVGTHSPLIYST